MSKARVKELVSQTSAILQREWARVSELAGQGDLADALSDPALVELIQRCIRSRTKTYRYVLPTQVLAKVCDPSLDCRCLQMSRGRKGAFDARTIAHQVVVPFDAANHCVLGGSQEPYVSNPLRVAEVSSRFAKAQRDKQGWTDLCNLLEALERKQSASFTELVFTQILIAIHRQLADVRIVYPAPMRIGLDKTIRVVEQFLQEQSGGDRVQAVACALFIVIGKRFGLYSKVERGVINAADLATGLAADLECISESGETVLAVEVKDKELTIAAIESKLQSARGKKIAEILFVAEKGIAREDEEKLPSRIETEFARGQNVYVFDLKALARVALALVGEQSRPEFLRLVGQQLDDFRSDIRHRRAWRDLLVAI